MSKVRILIVDDEEMNRQMLSDLISRLGYTPLLAEHGAQALEILNSEPVDVILLDIMMPVLDGYQTLELIEKNVNFHAIPVIVISGVDDIQSAARCLENGADDYLAKPFDPVILKSRLKGCLLKKQWRDREEQYKREIERHNLELEERVRQKVNELYSSQMATIFALAQLAESRDPETSDHLERMREYSKRLAAQLRKKPKYQKKINDSFIQRIYEAAPLHDIGKVSIPDRILQKSGKLTPEEYEIIKIHPVLGAKTLRQVDHKHPGNPTILMGIEIAESHHEKWDGSGYPFGLCAEIIPLSARIVALADAYDVISSKRIYKNAYSHEKSRDIIVADREAHFDPDVVDAFLEIENEFQTIHGNSED